MKEPNKVSEENNKMLAAWRLKVLRLAEEIGNISEACRLSGMKRVDFYKWKHRFAAHGIEGLKNLPPAHFAHPQKTLPEVEEMVIVTSLAQPSWGCVRLSNHLKGLGVYVSSPTVQKILLRHNLGYKYQRWLRMEENSGQRQEAGQEAER